MELYLVRHGAPYSKEEDPERHLNNNGIKDSHIAGKAFKQLGINFDLIVSSPKVRARQTAEIIAEEVGFSKDQIKFTKVLEPMIPADEAISYLKEFADTNRILVAGHLPSLGNIASELIKENSNMSINFETCGVCRIDVKQIPTNIGVLCWLLTPEHLGYIAQT